MKSHSWSLRELFFGLILGFSLLGGFGCGGSYSADFVTGQPSDSSGSPQAQGETVFTLESTLDTTAPVNAKSLLPTTSAIRIKTINSAGEETSSSPPIEVAPTISVRIPSDSAQVKIEYLDESQNLDEIWGAAMPLLENGSEFVVRDTNPDPVDGVVSLVIEGPQTVPFHIPTQYQARATYRDGSTRLITRSAAFSVTISGSPGTTTSSVSQPRNLANGILDASTLSRIGSRGSAQLTATFGGVVSRPFPIRTNTARLVGTPFFSDASGQFPVAQVELEGFGTRAQMRVFSDFDDGQRRDVTLATLYSSSPTAIIDVNTLGQITGFDAGSTVLSGQPTGARALAQTTVTVLKGYLETMFGTVRQRPNPIEGLSSIYALGDFNQDGRTDILGVPAEKIVESGLTFPDFSRLAVHLGNGDGTFQQPTFLALPFSGDGEGQIRFFTPRGGRLHAAVVHFGEPQLAIISGPITTRTTTARPMPSTVSVIPLESRVKSLMKAGEDQLLVRGEDDRLTGLGFLGATATPVRAAISYNGIGPEDFVTASGGYVFHHQAGRDELKVFAMPVIRSGTSSSLQLLKTVTFESSRARVTDILVGPLNNVSATGSSRTPDQQAALVSIVGLRSPAHDAIVIENLRDGNSFSNGTPVGLATDGQENIFSEEAEPRLTPMVLESANRRTPSLLVSSRGLDRSGTTRLDPVGVTVPQLHGGTARSAPLSGFPQGSSFERFEAGDVTGDGTTDLVIWQNGVITILELAAVRPAPPAPDQPTPQ